jgi:hypothetical protein
VTAPTTGEKLRGGHFTLDPRLDRIPWFDPASRGYQMRALLTREVVDRRSAAGKFWTPGPTLSQRNEGQCVSEAVHDAAHGTPNRVKPPVLSFDDRRAAYHQMQHDDPWVGCYLGLSCPIQPSAEAYGGTAVLAGAKYGKAKGWWREYRWIGAGSGRLEDDLIDTLRGVGGIVFGTVWREGMYETSPDGLLQVDGPEVGGHAYHGWEWAPRQRMPRHWKGTKPGVWIHNSWGPQEGETAQNRGGFGVTRRGVTGCAFVPLDQMLGLLEAGGEGMVPLA